MAALPQVSTRAPGSYRRQRLFWVVAVDVV